MLAYCNLRFDIENKCLIPDEEIIINKEFILDSAGDVKTRASINKFIPEDKQYLLNNFYNNINEIRSQEKKNDITHSLLHYTNSKITSRALSPFLSVILIILV